MLLSRFIPLVVLGGVGIHSGGAVKDRLSSVMGVSEKVVTKQRMISIMDSARLTLASSEEPLSFNSDAAFRKFVRKSIRIKGNDKADASLDMWGTPFKGKLNQRGLTVSSAGPDKKFGTPDDIVDTQDVYNF
jgi:hypothetical protein